MTCLVLLRHGESDGNAAGRFTGWADAPLTERGREQARRSGALLRAAGLSPTRLHTSVLARAIDTGALACEAGQVTDIPVRRSWRLNERHYGALQGRDRSAVVAQYGPDQVQRWRRSYDGRPPPVPRGGSGDPALDPRYAGLPVGLLPRAESLREVQDRVLPYWRGAVLPDLRTGHTVLVVGHSNSLRALIAWVDQLTAIEVENLDIPTGAPLLYDIDLEGTEDPDGGVDEAPGGSGEARRRGRARQRGGRYLDPMVTAAVGIEQARPGPAASPTPAPPARPWVAGCSSPPCATLG